MNNTKKIIIVVLSSIIIISAVIVFFLNYDIKIISDASVEYKNLLNLTNLDYYHDNHLIVLESSDSFSDINEDKVDNKTIQSSLYYLSNDGKLTKTMTCIDDNNNVLYTWFFYDGKQYVKYNNNSMDTYVLYNFEKNINIYDTDTVPNLKVFLNYTPQFQSRYQNSNEKEDNKYMDVYKLYFKDDDFYKNCLSKYVDNSKTAYLRVIVNNMNLVTSMGLTLEPTSKYVFGPFAYNYYYDKQYDISLFYDFVNKKRDDLIDITFKDVENDKVIDKISIDKKDVLFVEKGKNIEGIYLDRNCTNNYQDFINKKALDFKVPNVLSKDSILYVKYK